MEVITEEVWRSKLAGMTRHCMCDWSTTAARFRSYLVLQKFWVRGWSRAPHVNVTHGLWAAADGILSQPKNFATPSISVSLSANWRVMTRRQMLSGRWRRLLFSLHDTSARLSAHFLPRSAPLRNLGKFPARKSSPSLPRSLLSWAWALLVLIALGRVAHFDDPLNIFNKGHC